jgi:hypothetical protein
MKPSNQLDTSDGNETKVIKFIGASFAVVLLICIAKIPEFQFAALNVN